MCYEVLPLIQDLHGENSKDNSIFHNDNSHVHSAACIPDWLDEYSGTLWPLYLSTRPPGSNFIENMWNYVEQRVTCRQEVHRNLVALRDLLMSEGRQPLVAYLKNLVGSLPRRIQTVMKARDCVKLYNIDVSRG